MTVSWTSWAGPGPEEKDSLINEDAVPERWGLFLPALLLLLAKKPRLRQGFPMTGSSSKEEIAHAERPVTARA
jgi:hypothetical protein